MDVYGDLWTSMDIYGYVMDLYGRIWTCMSIYVYYIYGRTWTFIDIDGRIWTVLDMYGKGIKTWLDVSESNGIYYNAGN